MKVVNRRQYFLISTVCISLKPGGWGGRAENHTILGVGESYWERRSGTGYPCEVNLPPYIGSVQKGSLWDLAVRDNCQESWQLSLKGILLDGKNDHEPEV